MTDSQLSDILLTPFPDADSSRPIVIAGPCSAETEEQVMDTAMQLAGIGVGIFRAGIWKPRTKPGNFEGVGARGLAWLRKAKAATGMKTATEVATRAHVVAAIRAGVDYLWVGARTTGNPFAVDEIAAALKSAPDTPVLVKNPVGPDLEAWIGALQRLAAAGITRLAAVHRGFSRFAPSIYRNEPEWRIPIELHRRLPGLPILVDPSHIGGARNLVASLAQEAIDLHFSGLMIESHCTPDSAWSDAGQQLLPAELAHILDSLVLRRGDAPSERLDMLRDAIDTIDAQLLELLRRRMEASEKIGEYKRCHAMPVVQEKRYKALMEGRVAQGEAQGLSADFLRELFQSIHAESVKVQTRLNSRSEDGVSESK